MADGNPNVPIDKTDPAIVVAVANNDLKMVQLLMSHRGDPTVLSKDGHTLLMVAATHGRLNSSSLFTELIKQGLQR